MQHNLENGVLCFWIFLIYVEMISWLCSLPVVQDTFTFYPSLIFDHAIVFFLLFMVKWEPAAYI